MQIKFHVGFHPPPFNMVKKTPSIYKPNKGQPKHPELMNFLRVEAFIVWFILNFKAISYSIGGFEWIFISLVKKNILIPDIWKQPQTSLESIWKAN